jgi:hypothetical protein
MSKLSDAALDQTCMYAYLGFAIQSRDRGARALPQIHWHRPEVAGYLRCVDLQHVSFSGRRSHRYRIFA